MAKVIDIMNPQVKDFVIDEDNGRFKQAFLDVSGHPTLGFSSSAKITCSKPINGNELQIWYKLQNKITTYNNERAKNERKRTTTTNSEDNWCTFIVGYRDGNAIVIIEFYDKTIFSIEDDDIIGLPK
jgi:hypothetical protein